MPEDKGLYCSNDFTQSKKVEYLSLKKGKPDRHAVRLGGLPPWLQSPAWPFCPECDKASYYIGCISQTALPPTAAGADYLIYMFLCAECRILSLVRQMT